MSRHLGPHLLDMLMWSAGLQEMYIFNFNFGTSEINHHKNTSRPFDSKLKFSSYRDENDIDFFASGTLEKNVRGGIIGPTFSCVVASQFQKLKKGDRFWFERADSGFTTGRPTRVLLSNDSIFSIMLMSNQTDWTDENPNY